MSKALKCDICNKEIIQIKNLKYVYYASVEIKRNCTLPGEKPVQADICQYCADVIAKKSRRKRFLDTILGGRL